MDTYELRALQQAFLEGRADSALLTSLSRAQSAAAGATPAGDGECEAARRVVRRERHVTFVERRPVVRSGRVMSAR